VLPSLLLALREGLEIALLLSLLLGTLHRLGQSIMQKHIWRGTGSALLVSLLGAGVLTTLGMRLEGKSEAIFEGLTMLLAAAVLTWAIVWFHHRSRQWREHIAAQVEHRLTQGGTALYWLAFIIVAREGLELALFLTATSLRSGSLPSAVGGGLGLVVAALLGWGLYATVIRLNLRGFFFITNGMLVLFAAGLLAHGVHELNQMGWLPSGPAPIWNLNAFLDENSVLGQFLKTLFGYNGDPAFSEVAAYFLYLVLLGVGLRWLKPPARTA